VPQGWQGALPFRYHVGVVSGPGAVKGPLSSSPTGLSAPHHLGRDRQGQRHPKYPDDWVVAGNHRDAWVYGAVDPNSGHPAAMLESVHGIGALLKQGWRPKRTHGVLQLGCRGRRPHRLDRVGGAARQNAGERPWAYFNVDVAVAGPEFSAAAVPSLNNLSASSPAPCPVRRAQRSTTQWKMRHSEGNEHRASNAPKENEDVHVGDLGSGSDFTPFLQHVGVPSTDIGSSGPYGVYHSTFDDYAWYVQNADPHFVYLQEMARVLRPGNPAHGRRRRASLRLRDLCARH